MFLGKVERSSRSWYDKPLSYEGTSIWYNCLEVSHSHAPVLSQSCKSYLSLESRVSLYL